jgi:glutamine synthetase
LVSYFGHALDEKTPLLRSCDALSNQGKRLLNLLGYKVGGLKTNIGLEQELFFIDRASFLRRPDLQLAGRTVIGRMPPRGQEMCDHYSKYNFQNNTEKI